MKTLAGIRAGFSLKPCRKNKSPAQTELLSIPEAGLEPALSHPKWILNPPWFDFVVCKLPLRAALKNSESGSFVGLEPVGS